jgi:hypothetical protein
VNVRNILYIVFTKGRHHKCIFPIPQCLLVLIVRLIYTTDYWLLMVSSFIFISFLKSEIRILGSCLDIFINICSQRRDKKYVNYNLMDIKQHDSLTFINISNLRLEELQ